MFSGLFPDRYFPPRYFPNLGAVIPDPGGAATRFYPSLQVPNVRVEGPLRNSTWGDLTVFTSRWSETHWTWRLTTSKTDAGALSTDNVRTNRQGNYDFNYARWMTKPLTAQTVSGTLDFCVQVSQAWVDDVDPPADSSDVRFRLYAYISQGQTSLVRHVLCDYTGDTDFTFSTLTAKSPTSPIALTSGDTQAGDCVVIEFGFRIVSSPTPAPTYPPTNMTLIQFRGKGVSGADAVPGDTATTVTPWFEFSNTVTEQSDPAAPANDACADAISIPAAPYTSGFIDTTQSADTQRGAWWTYTAERTGTLICHTLGSNYQTEIDAFTGGCGVLAAVSSPIDSQVTGTHRSQTTYIFEATQGTIYHFRIRNRTTSQNAVNSGGSLRFSILYRETPLQNDIYLPCGNIGVFREGQMVHVSPNFTGSNPTGVAIDYTNTPMDDLNGGTHSSARLLVGLHNSELVEILDLITLNNGEFEIDFIGDPWSVVDVNIHPATLYVTADGTLFVGWFGDGYLVVAGTGTLPAVLSAVSSVPAYSAIKSIAATAGDSQAGAPYVDTEILVGVSNIAPWAITVDEANGVIYYADGGFYTPVGGQIIKRWSLTAGQLADFATLTAPAGCPNPGIKGLQFIPGGGLLVCNGSEVARLDSTGTVVQTYAPTLPALASRCLVDVKLTADGQAFWVVDLDTRLTKFNLTTGAELVSVQNYLFNATMTQMAIYQPGGIVEPPPEPEPEPEPAVPDCPDTLLDDSAPQSALARLMRVHTSPRRAQEELPSTADEGFSGVLSDASFGELVLGGMGSEDDSDDCLPIVTPPLKAMVGRFKVH